MEKHPTVAAYIAAAPKGVRAMLKEVRTIVRTAVPSATESIAYGMPAFAWKDKPLFYFAAMKGHLGLYPTSGPIQTCKDMLADFSTSKGCVRIPYTARVPKSLILRLLRERKKEISTAKR
jgi:uncharacterized protein YdhG (YjbR/CyaY superfamily)